MTSLWKTKFSKNCVPYMPFEKMSVKVFLVKQFVCSMFPGSPFISVSVIAGCEVQGERPHEVLEIRDHGRGYLVCAPGGSVLVPGTAIQYNLLFLTFHPRLRGSMISRTPPSYCMLTGSTICWGRRLSMGLD